MLAQEMVDIHANRIQLSAAAFQEIVSKKTDPVIADVSAHVLNSIKTVDGNILRSSENAENILAVEKILKAAIAASDYYPSIVAFVSDFTSQLNDFSNLYELMRLDTPGGEVLPPFSIDSTDMEMLLNQGEAAIAVLEAPVLQVNFELRPLLARSLGESGIVELVKGLSDSIRRMTRVEPMAKDQLILFFRTVGDIIYRKIESTGIKLGYSYVGQSKESTRKFCSELLNGKIYTREEIAAMGNGQVRDVFSNCGGYGCQHWWALAEIINPR